MKCTIQFTLFLLAAHGTFAAMLRGSTPAQCALSKCASQASACLADTQCKTKVTCALACTTESCIDSCAGASPDAATSALVSCAVAQGCVTSSTHATNVTSVGVLDDTFSTARALEFLHFSNAAYCDASTIDDWSCKPCQKADSTFKGKSFTDEKTEGQAFVGANDGNIVVAFRGSSNLDNWIADLSFKQVSAYPKCNGCEVHGGFYADWVALMPGIVNETLRLHKEQPNAQLFVTGHSLGAALAVLAASELHYTQGLTITAVYTYGEPRVGNKAFKDFYNQGTHLSWRITHNKDPVPKLPPTAFGFTHIQREVYYNEDSTSYKVCDGSGEDKTCSDSTISTDVNDHLSYLGITTGGAAC